jgi:hypothetical protein
MQANWMGVALAGVALAGTGVEAAQGGSTLANLPVSAMQNGRIVASTRTDARGGFRFDLVPGTYEFCVGPSPSPKAGIGASYDLGGATPSKRQALGGGASTIFGGGNQDRVYASSSADTLMAGGGRDYVGTGIRTVTPGANCANGLAPIRVPIPQPDGTIVYALLNAMQTNGAPGGDSGSTRIRMQYDDGDALAQTGTNPGGRSDRGVEPRTPPPAVATPRRVTFIGSLSLER